MHTTKDHHSRRYRCRCRCRHDGVDRKDSYGIPEKGNSTDVESIGTRLMAGAGYGTETTTTETWNEHWLRMSWTIEGGAADLDAIVSDRT